MQEHVSVLFTHRGISGPAALGISREVAEKMASGLRGGGVVTVDLAPDDVFDVLKSRFDEFER